MSPPPPQDGDHCDGGGDGGGAFDFVGEGESEDGADGDLADEGVLEHGVLEALSQAGVIGDLLDTVGNAARTEQEHADEPKELSRYAAEGGPAAPGYALAAPGQNPMRPPATSQPREPTDSGLLALLRLKAAHGLALWQRVSSQDAAQAESRRHDEPAAGAAPAAAAGAEVAAAGAEPGPAPRIEEPGACADTAVSGLVFGMHNGTLQAALASLEPPGPAPAEAPHPAEAAVEDAQDVCLADAAWEEAPPASPATGGGLDEQFLVACREGAACGIGDLLADLQNDLGIPDGLPDSGPEIPDELGAAMPVDSSPAQEQEVDRPWTAAGDEALPDRPWTAAGDDQASPADRCETVDLQAEEARRVEEELRARLGAKQAIMQATLKAILNVQELQEAAAVAAAAAAAEVAAAASAGPVEAPELGAGRPRPPELLEVPSAENTPPPAERAAPAPQATAIAPSPAKAGTSGTTSRGSAAAKKPPGGSGSRTSSSHRASRTRSEPRRVASKTSGAASGGPATPRKSPRFAPAPPAAPPKAGAGRPRAGGLAKQGRAHAAQSEPPKAEERARQEAEQPQGEAAANPAAAGGEERATVEPEKAGQPGGQPAQEEQPPGGADATVPWQGAPQLAHTGSQPALPELYCEITEAEFHEMLAAGLLQPDASACDDLFGVMELQAPWQPGGSPSGSYAPDGFGHDGHSPKSAHDAKSGAASAAEPASPASQAVEQAPAEASGNSRRAATRVSMKRHIPRRPGQDDHAKSSSRRHSMVQARKVPPVGKKPAAAGTQQGPLSVFFVPLDGQLRTNAPEAGQPRRAAATHSGSFRVAEPAEREEAADASDNAAGQGEDWQEEDEEDWHEPAEYMPADEQAAGAEAHEAGFNSSSAPPAGSALHSARALRSVRETLSARDPRPTPQQQELLRLVGGLDAGPQSARQPSRGFEGSAAFPSFAPHDSVAGVPHGMMGMQPPSEAWRLEAAGAAY